MSSTPNRPLPKALPLDRGAFILSLDTEFAWGDVDLPQKRYAEGQKQERLLTQRLLTLLKNYQIPATFAIVGALFSPPPKSFHEENFSEETLALFQRNWPNRAYYQAFSPKDFYAPDLLELLENSGLPHEIGSHSFSHIIFSSNECTPELAQWEFQKAYQLGQSFPSPCTSFVFPRNQCRYLNELYTSGFRSYRGEDPAWFNTLPLGKWGKKIGHILDLLWIQTPPCSLPLLEPSGLLNLQGSMNYLSMAGWRRYIPLKCRVQQAKKGILSAIRSKTLFHLWFHPSHLGEEEDLLFQGLDSIFAEVAQAREAGKLDVFTMGSLFLTLSHCYSFLKKL